MTLRKSILDPQGKAVEHAISMLGYKEISNVRIGKLVELDIDCSTKDDAERLTREICKKLLANPVMEDYTFTID